MVNRRLVILSTHQGCERPFESLFNNVIHLGELPPFEMQLTKDDCLLFEGGTDVSPLLYGEEFNGAGQPDVRRDAFEQVMFIKAKNLGIPMLGICRGSQFLNVMNGGKLYQDIGAAHCDTHEIETVDGIYMPATSTHHQMWKPTKEMELLAVAHLMNGYELEPEVGWYPKTKSLLIQGHPEYLHEGHPFWNFSVDLVKEYILEAQ